MNPSIRMSVALAGVWLATGCATVSTGADELCPPPGYDEVALSQLRAGEFSFATDAAREAFVLALPACLGSSDPDLRDGLGYTAMSALLRGGQLSESTIQALREHLLQDLENASDPSGVHRPFIVLALSEVARVDRVSPLFFDLQREQLVTTAARYLESVADYRGYNDREGWRHGVAHGADLVLQLVLNDQVGADQLRQLRSAVQAQIAPGRGHSYIFGEPQRLARPVLYMALRGEFSEAEWTAWFGELASPAPLESWDAVWSSERGLAKLHNTRAFAQAVYVATQRSSRPELQALLPGVNKLLEAIP